MKTLCVGGPLDGMTISAPTKFIEVPVEGGGIFKYVRQNLILGDTSIEICAPKHQSAVETLHMLVSFYIEAATAK